MEVYNFTLKSGKGKYTTLDKAYGQIINKVKRSAESTQERWEIYDLIIKEFTLLDAQLFKEFKYRLTDGEDVNKVLLHFFTRVDSNDISGMIWCLKKRVEEFIEEDFLNRFI